jgi:hypothetical protein
MRVLTAVVFSIAMFGAEGDWVQPLGGRAETNSDGSVRSLHLRSAWIADADLDRIAAMKSLESIDLSLTRVTDVGLLRLKDLENVRELNLFYAELITDEGLACMRNWQKIERINLRGTKVTDNTLAILAGKKSIRSLDIGFAEVTDSGLQHLATLTGLRELAFGGNKLTEVGLQVLRGMPQLEVLDLSGKQRTDSGLWFLGTTDIGMDPVATLGGLKALSLSGLTVTPRGVEKLRKLGKLERLDLHGCKRVGDDVVQHLAAMPGLKWVDLQDSGVTASGLAELRRLRPALRVDGRVEVKQAVAAAELENELVRVYRVVLGPREKKPAPETAPAGVIDVHLTAGGNEGIHPNMRLGCLRITGGAAYREILNLNDSQTTMLRVELKSAPVGKDLQVPPMRVEPDDAPRVVYEDAKLRVLRLSCASRRQCPDTGEAGRPALLVDFSDASGKVGRVLWQDDEAPALYNEFPVPIDLVRIEFKDTE